ncbi:coiled-coil domain-containing protein 175-like [Cheilinus undulatus]|uniref:coiled-coil domain-containing protein 175-like n=1 Tax=Cheilinus undulatus TaxID=241271 RepID=UPI001BD6A71B|nr:coiled-coil domain-containing protein 175-like [Cheilinus undulatus]
MASCLVPDFPAVLVVLEHIKELDKQLKEEGVPFSAEASLHLSEIAAAISALEGDRRAAHEHLEVETIENSKLRYQLNNTSERIRQEIMADVAAARATNEEEIEQLHQDLSTVSQLQEDTAKRKEALLSENEALYLEREQAKTEHEAVIASLNDQITLKYGLQDQLDQTHELNEELKSTIVALKQDKITVQQNMALEREAFSVKKDSLLKEEKDAEEKIKQQKQAVSVHIRELDRVNGKKMENHALHGELTIEMAKLESNIRRLTESRCQYMKQLEEETQRHQELKHESETLKKKLGELKEAFSVTAQRNKEKLTIVEGKLDEGRSSRLLHQDSLAQIRELYKHQEEEENEVRKEYLHVTQQLERSKLQLEERNASIIRHSKETNKMEQQIRELQEDCTINKRVFERNQEEICGNKDTKKKNISHFEEEKMRITELLKEAKRKQEEHVQKMSNDISSTRRRYEELCQEEAALHQRQPKSVDADLLISYMDHCEKEFKQEESKRLKEIEQYMAETEMIVKTNEEKLREVEEKEVKLKEVEENCSQEKSRNQQLEALTLELSRKKDHLELSIDELKEKTSSLLQSKEEMKAELKVLRANYMDVLNKQASELRAVEISIYNSKVYLEEVNMENSRLRLAIGQNTERLGRASEDTDRYRQETQQFKKDTLALYEKLQEALREDLLLIEDSQCRDSALLEQMSALLDKLKSRGQQLGTVSTLLHQQMLNFSKRLGDKATEEQQN